MKQSSKISLVIITSAFAVVGLFNPLAVFAEDSQQSITTEEGTTTNDQNATRAPRESREERKEVQREKLDDQKLKACTNREAQVNTTMGSVVSRSDRHIERITAIADRTKAFYVTKGYALDTYDTLVASVDRTYAAAQAAVDLLKTKATFSCESDGPASDIQDFRNQRINKIDAVTEYRDAVKALIVGVKSVQPEVRTNE